MVNSNKKSALSSLNEANPYVYLLCLCVFFNEPNLFKCFVYELHRVIVYFREKIRVKKKIKYNFWILLWNIAALVNSDLKKLGGGKDVFFVFKWLTMLCFLDKREENVPFLQISVTCVHIAYIYTV